MKRIRTIITGKVIDTFTNDNVSKFTLLTDDNTAVLPFVAFPTKKDGTPSKLYETIKTLKNGEYVLCHVNVAVNKDGELGVYLFAVDTSGSLQGKQ